MKKIICAICGFTMLCGAALADETSVAIDLNTPIRWYETAVREALTYIFGLSGESSKHSAQANAALIVSENFDVTNGVVTISPAELVGVCKYICEYMLDKKLDDDKVAGLCANMVIEATHKHNEIATKLSSSRYTEQKWTSDAVQRAFAFSGLNANDGVGQYEFFTFTNNLTNRIDKFLADRSYTASEDQIFRHCTIFASDEIRNSKHSDELMDFLTKLNMNGSSAICKRFVENLKSMSNNMNRTVLPQINRL